MQHVSAVHAWQCWTSSSRPSHPIQRLARGNGKIHTFKVLLACAGSLDINRAARASEAPEARHTNACIEEGDEGKLSQQEKRWGYVVVDRAVERQVELGERAPERDEMIYATLNVNQTARARGGVLRTLRSRCPCC